MCTDTLLSMITCPLRGGFHLLAGSLHCHTHVDVLARILRQTVRLVERSSRAVMLRENIVFEMLRRNIEVTNFLSLTWKISFSSVHLSQITARWCQSNMPSKSCLQSDRDVCRFFMSQGNFLGNKCFCGVREEIISMPAELLCFA